MIASCHRRHCCRSAAVISQLVRAAQRTVLGSHLIEYAPQGARYAGSDASGASSGVVGTGAFRPRRRRRATKGSPDTTCIGASRWSSQSDILRSGSAAAVDVHARSHAVGHSSPSRRSTTAWSEPHSKALTRPFAGGRYWDRTSDLFGVRRCEHDRDQQVSTGHDFPRVRRRPPGSAAVRGDWHSRRHPLVDH